MNLSLPIRRTPLARLSCTSLLPRPPVSRLRFYAAAPPQRNKPTSKFTNHKRKPLRNTWASRPLTLDGKSDISTMLRLHLHNRETQLAWVVFETSSHMKHEYLNADDIASLLQAYSFQARANVGAQDEIFAVERARRVWKELQEKYLSVGGTLWAGPDAMWFSNMVLIESLARNFERIEELWTEYRKQYPVGDWQAWNAVMAAFSKHSSYHQKVETLYQEMIALGLKVNGTTVAARIAATVHAHPEELERVALESNTGDSKGAQKFLSAVNEIIEQAYEHGVENIGPAFHQLIRAVLPFNDMDLVLKLYEYSQERGVVPDLFMCNTILKAYVTSGDVEGAMKFFGNELEGKWRLIPDISTVNTLLSGIAKSSGDIDAMTKIWTQIATLHPFIRRNAITYNIYLSAKLKNHPAAVSYVRDLIRQMINAGLFPTLFTYEYLLSAIEAAQQIHSYPHILKEMQARNLSPNAKMYSIIVLGLIRKKDAAEARKVYTMAGNELGIWPEDQTTALDELERNISGEPAEITHIVPKKFVIERDWRVKDGK